MFVVSGRLTTSTCNHLERVSRRSLPSRSVVAEAKRKMQSLTDAWMAQEILAT
jgi:hypothetical protein